MSCVIKCLKDCDLLFSVKHPCKTYHVYVADYCFLNTLSFNLVELTFQNALRWNKHFLSFPVWLQKRLAVSSSKTLVIHNFSIISQVRLCNFVLDIGEGPRTTLNPLDFMERSAINDLCQTSVCISQS